MPPLRGCCGPDFDRFVRPPKFISGRDTVSEGPLYPDTPKHKTL
jgi:hypothetical protein